jgi:hypothetical protein
VSAAVLGAAGPRLQLAVGPLEHDPAELRRRAEELLSRPPYAEDEPGILVRALGWAGDRLADLLSGGLGEVLSLPFLPFLVALLGVLALGAVVWRLTRGLVVDRSVAEVPPEVTRRSAAAWHADADAFTARGERREALRCRYAALVVGLVDRGAIEDLPGRTVRELDDEVERAAPDLAADVRDAGHRFERAIYGQLPVTDEDLERVRAAARRAAPGRGSGVQVGGRP